MFAGKVITAGEIGKRLEALTCDKCGTAFYFELTRIGIGKGSAPYLLGQKSASKRAAKAAQRDLTKRLAKEAELVPCPNCHWINQDLIEKYRSRQYRRAPLLIAFLMAGGFVAAPLAAGGVGAVFGYNSLGVVYVPLGVLAVFLLSPVWVLLIRRQLRRRIDPNVTYPRRPLIPPGTPPALIEQRDPRTGQPCLVPIASQDEDRVAQLHWATFRPAQVQLPPVCCVCLAATSSTYRPPLRVNDTSDLAVPVCDRCSMQLRRRWWLTVLFVAGVSLILGYLLSALLPGTDAAARWFLVCFMGSFGALVGGVIIAGRVCRPYRRVAVDRDRGIIKFAATNPGYTALLVDQVRKSDGLTAR